MARKAVAFVHPTAPLPEYLTSTEVAAILKVSRDTVIRRFQNLSGVIDLGTPERRFKRRYRSLRIPRSTLERFILETGV